MRNDDLKDFFNEDAYAELLDVYAEEAEQKHSIMADVHRKSDAPNKGDVPAVPRYPAVKRENRPVSSTRAPQEKGAHEVHKTSETSPVRTTAAPRTNAPAPQSHTIRQTSTATRTDVQNTPIQPLTPAAPPTKHEAFKLDIKGLDEEFQQPSTPEKRTEVPHTRAVSYVPHTARQNKGAFANFPEVVKKHFAPQEKADESFAVAEDLPQADEAVKIPKKLDWDTVKAFFVKNKTAWILIGICLAMAIIISTYTISCLNDVFAVNRDSETVVTINIPTEANTKTVLKILQQNGLIKHRHFCKVVAKVMDFKDDNYLTGVYYVTASMGVEKMLTTFKSPTTTGETVTLTFPEGFTVDQIMQKLEKYEVCTAAVLYKTMQEVDFSNEFSFIASMDDKEARYRMLEGYLYPDTYEFYVGESPSSVLRKFLNNFNKKWTDEYAAQAEKLGMSVDDIITLASIIQKEAYGAEQSPAVSSVLHNRLNKSGLYPSLQCDSTEEYINEYIKANTKDASQFSKLLDRYSSYKCVGLPVGPICNPGNDAIEAALFPDKSDYYFFAHDVNKKLYLARNDNERRSNNLAILNANSEAEKKKSNP